MNRHLRFLAATLLLLPSACQRAPSRPDVLLVTLDTTRADHLGAYGRPDVRTPVLDRLARQGVLFTDAVADVPVTLPSHSTIFTGIPALGHGVRYNGDYTLSERAETLAERLSDAGWSTAAFVATLVLESRFGLAQGFDVYDDDLRSPYGKHDLSLYPPELEHALPAAERRAHQVNAAARPWLAAAPSPFFAWVHYYDAHSPFDPPPPWADTHADGYSAEIQFADRELGRLLQTLDDRGSAGGTIVIVTADHGEGLEDHREDRHGVFVYDELIRVPLVVRAPGLPRGAVRSAQVRTVDIASTVLDLAGAGGPLGVGGSLRPAAEGTGTPPDPVAYVESEKSRLFYGGSGLQGIRTDRYKYLWAPRPELYDLIRDPGETRNLAASDPVRTHDAHERFEAVVRDLLDRDLAVAKASELDEATAGRLRSLGYLTDSGEAVRPRTLEEELARPGLDPKDLVDAVQSGRDVSNGFYRRALEKIERFEVTVESPDRSPELASLWSMAMQNRGAAQVALGEYDAAARSYREALRYRAANDEARRGLPFALNLAGRYEDAVGAADAVLRDAPGDCRVRLHRGLGLALLGRTEAARKALAVLADECPDPDVRQVAARYRDALGSTEGDRLLDLYRASGGQATRW